MRSGEWGCGRWLALAAVLVLPGPAVSGEPAETPWVLHRDPFERPPLPRPAKTTSAQARARVAPAPPPREPELRATLVGSPAPAADLDGRILTPGQTIRGYRLLEVREREVVLERDGARQVLRMED